MSSETGGELHSAFGRVVPVQVHRVAVVGYPQVLIAVGVVVEEQDRKRPACGVADSISETIFPRRIVALELRTGVAVLEQHRASIWVKQLDLPSSNSRFLGYLAERKVTAVVVQEVEVAVM